MANTIGIIGSVNKVEVINFINDKVNNFLNIDFMYENYYGNVYKLVPVDGKISSEQVYAYLDFINSSSMTGVNKVGIIEQMDKMSVNNQNKLLKTLEENGDNCLQIVISGQENKLIKTVLSRLVIYYFNDFNVDNLTSVEVDHPFYQSIIKSDDELINVRCSEYLETVLAIYDSVNAGDYVRPYVLFTTLIKVVDGVVCDVIIRILMTKMYELKMYDLVKQLIDIEARNYYQINKKLLVEAAFLIIHEEFVWKE